MKLQEAIRINTVLKGAPVLKDDLSVIQALQLGIEAIKAIEIYRSANESWLSLPLPGETKD